MLGFFASGVRPKEASKAHRGNFSPSLGCLVHVHNPTYCLRSLGCLELGLSLGRKIYQGDEFMSKPGRLAQGGVFGAKGAGLTIWG